LGPRRLEIHGRPSRSSSIDENLTLPVGATGPVFTIAGYAPIALQMMLVRYWHTHGEPPAIVTLPRGQVTIERTGRDRVAAAGGRQAELTRYRLSGLIWGREWGWFDDGGGLVAGGNGESGVDPFE